MTGYQLQHHPRAHNIKIKIQPNGQVVVVAPRDCPVFFINRFVASHQDWIDKNVAKVKKRRADQQIDENVISVFGKSYHKEINTSLDGEIGVKIKADKMIITPVSETTTSIDKTITQFLKNTAEKYIIPRTHQLAKKMSISFKHISLKQQKTRWGSCSSEGNLNFNWRLVHSPPAVIDYVIVHELAHRTEMNHSARFWDIVRKYDPEYLKHRGWLKRQGMALS